jgi:type VI secretion system protein ImpH
METLVDYAAYLTQLPVDLRAEVVVADMLEDGISPDDLIINSIGPFKRAFGRDISGARWVEGSTRLQRWLQIDLNRTGLYDLLPEGVFHQPTTNDASVSKEATLREMGIQHERERAARRFFLPIEQEFFRHRARIEQEQRAFLFENDAALSDNHLLDWFWNLPNFLTPRQVKRLMYLLPEIHRMAGDLPTMEACFGQLVVDRVTLTTHSPENERVNAGITGANACRLGQWQLGADVAFEGWVNDGEPLLRITVHVDSPERLTDYLPGGSGLQLLSWLAGYLVPLTTGFRIELDTSALDNTFLFASDAGFGRLDFTTCI